MNNEISTKEVVAHFSKALESLLFWVESRINFWQSPLQKDSISSEIVAGQLLTAEQAAQILNVSKSFLYSLIA